MDITIKKIKQVMEKHNYYAEDNLIWETYINVDKMINSGTIGQSIYSICLEGPPGSGKTEYAKVYKQVLSEILQENVELVQYQCDSTTGKAELYEEIRVAAAIAGDVNKVLIPGKLVEAIDLVNLGKKVVLFLDEYDKAREETDAFLLGFLQEGRINTTQRGELKIDPINYKNLQVILCKNQTRDELSGPLERRVKIIRLKEMEPNTFVKVAKSMLPEVDKDMLKMITHLYSEIYKQKEDFDRIPSCSELLSAIQESSTMIKAKAPTYHIYQNILSNMLKNLKDVERFEAIISENENLKVFSEKLVEESIDNEQAKMERTEKPETTETINVKENLQFVKQEDIGEVRSNSFSKIEMEKSVFDYSDKEWYEIGSVVIENVKQTANLSFEENKAVKLLENIFIKSIASICKDGFVLYKDSNTFLITVRVVDREISENNEENIVNKYKFFSNKLVIPMHILKSIKEFIQVLIEIEENLNSLKLKCIITSHKEIDFLTKLDDGSYYLDFISCGANMVESICDLFIRLKIDKDCSLEEPKVYLKKLMYMQKK